MLKKSIGLHLASSICCRDCNIEFCAPDFSGAQDLYNKIYADPVALQHYHADVNHASSVSVEPWLDDKRTVRFTIAVALPAVIKKAIGMLLGPLHAGI